MQHTNGTRAPAQGFSPLKAAAALLVALALMLAAWSLTAGGDDPSVPSRPQGPAVPSREQILAEFERLDDIRIRFFENHDRSLLPQVGYPGSPFEKEALKELGALIRDNVSSRLKVFQEQLSVKRVGVDEAVIRQEVVRRIRFFNAQGEDVSLLKRPVRQVVEWTLRRDGLGRWLIFSARTLLSVEVKGEAR
jgi:hypothetical protein